MESLEIGNGTSPTGNRSRSFHDRRIPRSPSPPQHHCPAHCRIYDLPDGARLRIGILKGNIVKYVAGFLASMLFISILGLVNALALENARNMVYEECSMNGKALMPGVGWIQCAPIKATASVTITN